MTDEPTNDKERALHHLGEAEKALREAMKQAGVWTAAYMQLHDTMDALHDAQAEVRDWED